MWKKVEKTEKKLLTNGGRGGIIYELSREGGGRRKAAGENLKKVLDKAEPMRYNAKAAREKRRRAKKSQKSAWQKTPDEI